MLKGSGLNLNLVNTHPTSHAYRSSAISGFFARAPSVDPVSGTDKFRYRYEDQLGSLSCMKAALSCTFVCSANGMADEDATKLADYGSRSERISKHRTAVFWILDYGRPVERPSVETRCVSTVRGLRPPFDGDHGSRSERTSQWHTVPQDDVNEGSTTFSTPNTTITITGASFSTDEFKGMQLSVADPANGAFYTGTVQSNTSTTIVVEDAAQYIIDAIKMDDLSFVVYDLVDTNVATSGSYHTAGIWTGSPSYSDPYTTFTDSGAAFASYMVGWLVCVNTSNFAYLEIVGQTSTTLVVKGDASGLTLPGERYWIFAPPHVDPATGALRGSYTGSTFEPECDTHYLWGLYRYQPPMAGYFVDPDGEGPLVPGVYGNQDGTNQAGWYDAGARRHDPSIRRWTTPDPAATPWSNLHDYSGLKPQTQNDPTGLGFAGTLFKIFKIGKAASDGGRTGNAAAKAWFEFADACLSDTKENCKLQMEERITSFCKKMCDPVKGKQQEGWCIESCTVAMTAKKSELVEKLCDDPDRHAVDQDLFKKDYTGMSDDEIGTHLKDMLKKHPGSDLADMKKRRRNYADAWDICRAQCDIQYDKCVDDAGIDFTGSKREACLDQLTECRKKCGKYWDKFEIVDAKCTKAEKEQKKEKDK